MLSGTKLQELGDVNETASWCYAKKHIFILTAIVILATCLRLVPYAEFSQGSLTFVGTCGQLFDEAKPLFDSKNPLHFEVFFYPPVAPIRVATLIPMLKSRQ